MNNPWGKRVVSAAVLLAGLSGAKLIDDFLYNTPADLGLSNSVGQMLAVVYFIVTSVLLVLAARDQPAGYAGNLGLGAFLALAVFLKHSGEGLFTGAWRSGLFSQSLAFGTLLTALGLAMMSFKAWQYTRQRRA